MYYKFTNSFGSKDNWVLYTKIIKRDEHSCRVFQFETPKQTNSFSIGFDYGLFGNIKTNDWEYYEDMAEYIPIKREEFESALISFRIELNKFLDQELKKQSSLNL